MFDALIQAIQDGVKTTSILSCSGDEYFTRQVVLPPPEPTAEPIVIQTLTGFADFINSGHLDGITDVDDWVIHVKSTSQVELIDAPMGRHFQRHVWAIADCSQIIGHGALFERFIPLEHFIVNVMSQFVPTESQGELLKLAKRGMVRTADIEVPTPFILAPYRTFPEVKQPVSSFVFHLRAGRDGIEAALVEADGGQWKCDAIQRIKSYLNMAINRERETPIPIVA